MKWERDIGNRSWIMVLMGAEAKIRMKKDKITLEVEGDKKSTNPKMYAKREFVSNIGQVGGKEDRERRGVKKKTFLMTQ